MLVAAVEPETVTMPDVQLLLSAPKTLFLLAKDWPVLNNAVIQMNYLDFLSPVT